MTTSTTNTTTNRTAIVTGAARGIGASVAKRLGADGLAVAVLDLDETAASRPPSSGSPLSWASRRCWSTTPGSSVTTCCSR